MHCVKSFRIRNFSGLYFPAFGLNTYLSVFSLNAGKQGTVKLPIQALFTQCYIYELLPPIRKFSQHPNTFNTCCRTEYFKNSFSLSFINDGNPDSWISWIQIVLMQHLLYIYKSLLKFNRPFHCVKSIRIRSYSCPHFSAFELNRERYGVSVLMRENADQNNSE